MNQLAVVKQQFQSQIDRDRDIDKGELNLQSQNQQRKLEQIKTSILELVNLKVSEKKDGASETRKIKLASIENLNSPGPIANVLSEDLKEGIYFRTDLLLEISQKKASVIDDSLFDWVKSETETYINKQTESGTQFIKNNLFSRGMGDRVLGPTEAFLDKMQVIRLGALRKIEIARKESKLKKMDEDNANEKTNKVFIVHGHDDELKEKVSNFVKGVGLNPLILHELPSQGKTIIEKFETYSNVCFAIALLTPDDVGSSKNNQGDLKPRARQNVLFELGFFIGKIGRRNVRCLYMEGVEKPSDYDGVIYIKIDPENNWQCELKKEMKDAGLILT
ncbi:MAG TPA: nucleotide-binding protein [bacterium]|nr:nucleotide-binding protein [bacterium]